MPENFLKNQKRKESKYREIARNSSISAVKAKKEYSKSPKSPKKSLAHRKSAQTGEPELSPLKCGHHFTGPWECMFRMLCFRKLPKHFLKFKHNLSKLMHIIIIYTWVLSRICKTHLIQYSNMFSSRGAAMKTYLRSTRIPKRSTESPKLHLRFGT